MYFLCQTLATSYVLVNCGEEKPVVSTSNRSKERLKCLSDFSVF